MQSSRDSSSSRSVACNFSVKPEAYLPSCHLSLFFFFFLIYRRDRKFEKEKEIFQDFYFNGWTLTNWLDDFSILFDSMNLPSFHRK